ncbi:hypothetical protein N7468_007498 [Penicillium chermesinum]|uniref:BZIP domain-containing protein n=1 Tax=Penicillium chermesinum TaxID=63820 RepID=A0A9W9NUK0_9EURO|nr:uncharacterized protein N7468_007498 [Penicillium chermesinum]KAJ5226273.1 hypothetical protein N7468_007498 [Penicillium chermesinum]KAJ6160544.1 hypothetical protein N7470_003940 [Penicillium chermesinum]
MDRNEEEQSKKRDNRSSSRTVASLSADQLERKRANDREAQRLNRLKARQRLEQLEQEVIELREQLSGMHMQNEQLCQHSAALQDENRRLKQELAMYKGQTELPGIEESNTVYPSGWYPDDKTGPAYIPRARSAFQTSSRTRTSQANEWPSQSTSRSVSLGQTSNPVYSARMDQYTEEAQRHARDAGHMQAGSIEGRFGGVVGGMVYPEAQQAGALPPYQHMQNAIPSTYLPPSSDPYASASSQPRLPYPPTEWPSQAYETPRR